ncbi:MAG: hypothetical protein GXO25_07660 [Euryarchaeota archaeon]|nr:hypothetical protein [Euryarchaeota archaeon]
MKEKGFTNGNIRINTSRGMINGLTNGNGTKDGLINGNGNPEQKKKKSTMGSPKGRAGTWLVIGVVLLLVFGVFAISTNSLKKTDWNLIKKYTDVDTEKVVDAVNITKFAFHETSSAFEFYIKFAGDFGNTGEYQHLAFILIDNDSNPNTGYDAGYLGADYMIKIAGNNGTITGSFYKFQGDNRNMWNWSSLGGVGVSKSKNNEVTGAVNAKISADAKLMVVAETRYSEDITPVVGIEKSALLVYEEPNLKNDTLAIKLIPMYGPVDVKEIDLYASEGVMLSGSNVKGDKIVNIGTLSTIPKTVYVKIDTANVINSAVKVAVSDVSTSAPVTIWGRDFKKFVGTPSNITIDGCFADWEHLVGPKNYHYNPTGDVENANIDLYQYAMYDKGGDYFYASVLGHMLAGNIAPEMVKTTHWTGPGENETAKSPFDSATITFTTQSGETHTIQVFGVLGKVMLVLFDGKPTTKVSVGVGVNEGYGAIEIGIDGATYNIKTYKVTMTDWNGLSDVGVAHSNGEKSSGPGVYAPEFNMGYLAVLLLIVPIIVRRKKN